MLLRKVSVVSMVTIFDMNTKSETVNKKQDSLLKVLFPVLVYHWFRHDPTPLGD